MTAPVATHRFQIGDRVANPDLYNTQFFPVPGPQGERLTAVQLGKPEGDPDKPNTDEHLAGIDFADSQHGWTAGVNGTLLHTEDGGATWATITAYTGPTGTSVENAFPIIAIDRAPT